MSEHFTPLSFERLLAWVLSELNQKRTVFGIPEELFFKPSAEDCFSGTRYGKLLETPIGVAAGPHTQMAQNIIAAWLCGARYIELKTVQTLDELKVTKPCIDAEDEGYNCEWSQELKLEQSFEEYLKAWVIIHILKHRLGQKKQELGAIFNMSVGYNLEGIKKKNVQEFISRMTSAGDFLKNYLQIARKHYPAVRNLLIPDKISDSITLSTMHGCPPSEIEKIASYLLSQMGIHTTIKFNPTLLGAEMLRWALNEKLGFTTVVPDEAFCHDPKFEDALQIIRNLKAVSKKCGREFNIKLTNTLESLNLRNVFPAHEKMNYMSGRALHPLDAILAAQLIDEFKGEIELSFSGGADAFNLPELVACNIRPITVCTDILKPGGYGRLSQYLEKLDKAMKSFKAPDFDSFVVAKCLNDQQSSRVAIELLSRELKKSLARKLTAGLTKQPELGGTILKAVSKIFPELNLEDRKSLGILTVRQCSRVNATAYMDEALEDERYNHSSQAGISIKGERELSAFDCIYAPCTEKCCTGQKAPDYMFSVAGRKYPEAMQVILTDNPLPGIAGRVCDHLCQTRCLRGQYDRPMQIREIKRFVTDTVKTKPVKMERDSRKIAVIGAGPGGLSCASVLAAHGLGVTVFEANRKPGGMAAFTIPSFRLSAGKIAEDIQRIEKMGVEFRYGVRVGTDISLAQIRKHHDAVFIATGAWSGVKLGIPGEESSGVIDALEFLGNLRNGKMMELGKKVGIVGGGNSAVDVARAAWRIKGVSEVYLIYRRTEHEMPADRDEIRELKEEGIRLLELTAPVKISVKAGKMKSLVCQRMKLGEPDESGRRKPVPMKGSEFEIRLDTLIPAIGQQTVTGFADKSGLKLDKKGLIIADPVSLETNLSGVYAGGDAVRGPATLIAAVGDGKKAALKILGLITRGSLIDKGLSYSELICRKSHRVYPEALKEIPVEKRRNFKEGTLTLDEDKAMAEAARCLYCDQLCSICATVCPNRANLTYEVSPFKVDWKTGDIELKLEVVQGYQVLNVHDFCNECGNCRTFCPSSGAPYKDKPRLYLDRKAFDSDKDDCLHFDKTSGKLLSKHAKKKYSILKKGKSFLFEGSSTCEIGPDLSLKKVTGKQSREDLELCFKLLVIYKGITESAGYLF
ncbi:MAG: FAD-dependent oxidoreductase [Candidatus Wallbacteria bacterium]|nr:FAD-dependent oxidoreductase [Candidatus Wallbacteria bacterium]